MHMPCLHIEVILQVIKTMYQLLESEILSMIVISAVVANSTYRTTGILSFVYGITLLFSSLLLLCCIFLAILFNVARTSQGGDSASSLLGVEALGVGEGGMMACDSGRPAGHSGGESEPTTHSGCCAQRQLLEFLPALAVPVRYQISL